MPVSVRNGNTSSARRFLRRSSIGSMPSSSAAWSTARSSSAVASGRPAPRYAPVGVVLVAATTTSNWIAAEAVGAVRHPPRAGRQERADAGVGAGVADEADAQAGERAVAAAAELDVLDLRPAVRQGEHVLAARRHPRRPGRPRRCAAAATTICSGYSPALPPKPPPTCGVTTSDLRRAARPSARGEQLVQEVRHLRRAVDRAAGRRHRARRPRRAAPSGRRRCAG